MQTTYIIIHRSLKTQCNLSMQSFIMPLKQDDYAINQEMNYNVEHYISGYGQLVEYL